MKCKEVKAYYESGKLKDHYFVDENGDRHGENRYYHENGQSWWRHFSINGRIYGESQCFKDDGTLDFHHLCGGECDELATVTFLGEPSTHSEEQLIQIAKEHGLPLLSELPKTEAELTHWNLKWPECPCLPTPTE